MNRPPTRPVWQSAVVALSGTMIAFILVVTLYWARSVVIPLAMAIFFTFVLVPVVAWFQRRGLPRVPAVLVTVAMAGLFFAAGVFVLGQQFASLMQSLPNKEPVIRAKVERMKSWVSGGESQLGHFFDAMQNLVTPVNNASNAPREVIVEPQRSAWTSHLQAVASPVIEMLGQSAFSLVLVIFMLIRREDLRNRFLRLVGQQRVTAATKASDDATKRLSRYLLAQLVLNVCFGLTIALVLTIIGLEYAALWGFIGTVLRYVPYVGTWIALVMPVLFSFVTSPGLTQPAVVFALFIGLELVCGNAIEPRLYGHTLGVSEVAQLVCAGFWSFLWGPVGLILSGPLTTCLVVLGKHVPALRFLDVLLGDEPPLDAGVVLFQRLTARDTDEAARLIRTELKSAEEPIAVFDRVVIPALRHLRQTTLEGHLESHEEGVVLDGLREVLAEAMESPVVVASTGEARTRVLICPARDAVDEMAGDMFASLLPADRWEAQVTTADTLTAEFVERVVNFRPAVVVIGTLPPGGLAHTRLMCKRLAVRQPDVRIVIGRWGETEDLTVERADLQIVGAASVCESLDATRRQLQEWLPVMQSAASTIGTNAATVNSVSVATAIPPFLEGASWPKSAIK